MFFNMSLVVGWLTSTHTNPKTSDVHHHGVRPILNFDLAVKHISWRITLSRTTVRSIHSTRTRIQRKSNTEHQEALPYQEVYQEALLLPKSQLCKGNRIRWSDVRFAREVMRLNIRKRVDRPIGASAFDFFGALKLLKK